MVRSELLNMVEEDDCVIIIKNSGQMQISMKNFKDEEIMQQNTLTGLGFMILMTKNEEFRNDFQRKVNQLFLNAERDWKNGNKVETDQGRKSGNPSESDSNPA